jgi:hypothetical protein
MLKRTLILLLILLSVPCFAAKTYRNLESMPKALAAQMQTYFGKSQKYKWNRVIREDFRNVPVYFVVGRFTDDHWKAIHEYGLVYEVFSRNIAASGKLYTSRPYLDDYVIKFEFKDLNNDGINEIIVNDEDESNQGIEIFAFTKENTYKKIFFLDCTMDVMANDRFAINNEKTHEFVDINGDGLMELVVHCPCYKFKDNKYVETREKTYQIYKGPKQISTSKQKAINLSSFLHKNITWYADSAILLDLNADGKQDIVLERDGYETVTFEIYSPGKEGKYVKVFETTPFGC